MREYSIAYIRILDLITDDVQIYINQLLRDGYSYSTIKKQFNLVTAFVRFLLAEGVPVRPVHLNVSLPIAEKAKKPKKEIVTYNKIEQVKLQKAIMADGEPAAFVVLLMLENGLRSGEVLALCWEDIDWDRRAVRIHRTLVHPTSKAKCFIQEGAKSKTSNRTIPLSPKVLNALEILLDKAESPTGLIFRSAKYPNEPMNYNVLSKHIQELCDQA